jgi:hypothetical protein
MPKANHKEPWTPERLEELKRLAHQGAAARDIALKMGRTRAAIEAQARRLGLSLKGY